MRVIVVSLTGSSWMTRWRVAAAQSMSSFRSANSPTPKLSRERSEKTGIAVPAPCHCRSGRRDVSDASTSSSPSAAAPLQRRFSPSSQTTGRPVARSMTSSLKAAPSGSVRRRLHSGNSPSSKGTMRCQPSRRSEAMASCSPGRMSGATTRSLSYRSGLGGTLRTALPTGKHRPREGRREEGGSGGELLPAVADADLAAGEPARQTEPVAAPLGADADPLALDRIAVGRSVASARCVADAAPEPVSHIVQDDAPPAPEEHELLAPLGAVFDFKEEFHRPEYVWGGF